MKDLGPLRYFFGIEICWSPKGYPLSQSKYVSDILDRPTDSKTTDTPMGANVRYPPSDVISLQDLTMYHTVVGSLVYLTISVQILPMLFILSVSSSLPPQWSIGLLFFAFYAMFKLLCFKIYRSPLYLHLCCGFSPMLIGKVTMLIINLPLVFVCFLRILSYHGKVRNNKMFLILLLRLK